MVEEATAKSETLRVMLETSQAQEMAFAAQAGWVKDEIEMRQDIKNEEEQIRLKAERRKREEKYLRRSAGRQICAEMKDARLRGRS